MLCAAGAAGCGPVETAVLRSATSPDGRYRAELSATRGLAGATDADPLTVTVDALAAGGRADPVVDRAALPVPASAGALALRWAGPRHLVLSCAACPPGPGPGSGRLPTSERPWRDVVITLEAFPDDGGGGGERRRPAI